MSDPITAPDLEQLMHERTSDVDAALRAVSPIGLTIGLNELQVFLGVDATAEPAGFAARAIDYLREYRLIDEFSAILQRCTAISAEKAANMQMPLDLARRLMTETVAARCAIYKGGVFQGSGCLVGPSLVLTCAHVLGPDQPSEDFPGIEVVLSTNVRIGAETRAIRFSGVAAADRTLPLSGNDADFAGRDDYALLRLRLPAANARIASIETDDWLPTRNAALTIFHYPQGQDSGIGAGFIATFKDPSVRWAYAGPGAPGSSGGGCFNVRGALVGLHQGKLPNGSRLVPFRRFRDAIAPDIAGDLAPAHLWSVDGHLEGTLVIGREDLFSAFAKLAERGGSYRALRVRRLDPALGADGLGYTVRLIQQLIKRRPDGHAALTLGWPQVVQQDFDIIDALAALARDRGLTGIEAGAEVNGAATGQTGQATVARGRAKSLLQALDNHAAAAGETLWIMIEHSTVPLGNQIATLEALASEIPLWPHMRLVMVGNEAVTLPEPEFRVSDIAANALPGAMLVEYIRPFERQAIEAFIDLIHADFMGEAPTPKQRTVWTDHVLNGLAAQNGSYALSDMPVVTQRLRAIFGMMAPMAQAA